MTDQPSTSDDDDEDENEFARFSLPQPPMEVYGKYDPETGSYYYDGDPFDWDGWTYNFLLEKQGRGEALTRFERQFVKWEDAKRARADAPGGGQARNMDRPRQRDLFSDLPDDGGAPADGQQPTSVEPE